MQLIRQWQAAFLVVLLNAVILVTAQRTNYRRPISKPTTFRPRIRPFTSAAWLKPEGTKKGINCIRPNSLLPDPLDPLSYKFCVPKGVNWIVYSFSCPQKTYFSEMVNRCVSGIPPRTATVSSIAETIINDNSGFSVSINSTRTTNSPTVASNVSKGSTPPSVSGIKTVTTSSSNIAPMTGGTEPDVTTMPSTDSSSSSSEEYMEIFLTHPPHFTNRPPPPPPLITGQLAIPHFIENYQPLGHPYYTTVEPLTTITGPSTTDFTTGKPNIHESHKLATWQSLNQLPTSTKMTTTVTTTKEPNIDRTNATNGKLNNPLEFFNSLDRFDEKIVQNFLAETDQLATKRPIRWKPNIKAGTFPTRERFPGGMRPSLQSN